MKTSLVVVAIWTCLMLCAPLLSGQGITLVVSRDTTQQEYGAFLTKVRNAVKAGQTCHGLPMASGKSANPAFVAVNLQAKSSGNTISLGFQRSDLYLEAYADQYGGNCRYRIFSDGNANVKSFLCGTTKQPGGDINNINYKKNYNDIETNAKTTRAKFGLGMVKLESRIDKIYGKSKKDDNAYVKNEAEFLLLAIQMVGEATRSKYIEDKIKANLMDNEYKPDPRATSLEENWSKISESMAAQADPNGSITMPKDMKDENGKAWTTETIVNLKTKYMALLTFVSTCKVRSPVFYFLEGSTTHQ